MKLLPLSLVFLLMSVSASAREISGVEVPETLSIDSQQLQLNGAGVRSKFFMDLYVGGLYLPEKATTTTTVLSENSAVVSLKILSGLITSEKMRNAIEEGFDDATEGKTQPIAEEIKHFTALFEDEIKVGDEFLLVTNKQHGVTAYKNGVAKDTIAGEDFREALLKIWLGDDPAQKSLKKEMLGQ